MKHLFLILIVGFLSAPFASGHPNQEPDPEKKAAPGEHPKVPEPEVKVLAMEKFLYDWVKRYHCAESREWHEGLLPLTEWLKKDEHFKDVDFKDKKDKTKEVGLLETITRMEAVFKIEATPGMGLLERFARLCMHMPNKKADDYFKTIYGEPKKMSMKERTEALEMNFDPLERNRRDVLRKGMTPANRLEFLKTFMGHTYDKKIETPEQFGEKFKAIAGHAAPTIDPDAKMSDEDKAKYEKEMKKIEDIVEADWKKMMQAYRNPVTGVLPGTLIQRIDRLEVIFGHINKK